MRKTATTQGRCAASAAGYVGLHAACSCLYHSRCFSSLVLVGFATPCLVMSCASGILHLCLLSFAPNDCIHLNTSKNLACL